LTLLKRQGGICACGCGRSLALGYHIDHRIALSKGGTNWPWNLQLLAPVCNLKKSNK
jgi:5-methylcytosine-specific restriction endonuclease McrA